MLNHIAVALVPIANVDGYAIQQRRSADGYDLNRDQSKLEDAVTLLLKQSYQQWNPDVALDIHNIHLYVVSFNLLRGVPTANAADVLFLPTGHLNAPLALRTLSEELFRREAEVVLNKCRLCFRFLLYSSCGRWFPCSCKRCQKSAVQFYFSSIDGGCIAFLSK